MVAADNRQKHMCKAAAPQIRPTRDPKPLRHCSIDLRPDCHDEHAAQALDPVQYTEIDSERAASFEEVGVSGEYNPEDCGLGSSVYVRESMIPSSSLSTADNIQGFSTNWTPPTAATQVYLPFYSRFWIGDEEDHLFE